MYLYHIQGVPKTTSVDAGALISTIYITDLILCRIEVWEFVDTSTIFVNIRCSEILFVSKNCVFPVNNKGLPNLQLLGLIKIEAQFLATLHIVQ